MARNLNKTGNTNTGDKLEQPLLDIGGYPGRLVQIIYLGVHPQMAWQGKEKPPIDRVQLTYELSSEFMVDEDGNPREDKPLWKSEEIPLFNLSAERATSTQRYNVLDPKGAAGGTLDKCLGNPCTVVVIHKEGSGKNAGRTFANVGDIGAPPKLPGYTQPPLVNTPSSFDPWDDNVTLEAFRELPEFIQTKITSALDFSASPLAALLGAGSSKAAEDVPSTPDEAPEASDGEEEMYD